MSVGRHRNWRVKASSCLHTQPNYGPPSRLPADSPTFPEALLSCSKPFPAICCAEPRASAAFCCASLAVSPALFAALDADEDVLCRTCRGDARRGRSACAVCRENSARYMTGEGGVESVVSFGNDDQESHGSRRLALRGKNGIQIPASEH